MVVAAAAAQTPRVPVQRVAPMRQPAQPVLREAAVVLAVPMVVATQVRVVEMGYAALALRLEGLSGRECHNPRGQQGFHARPKPLRTDLRHRATMLNYAGTGFVRLRPNYLVPAASPDYVSVRLGVVQQGVLQVSVGGVWGYVGGGGFDAAAARVACRQLGLLPPDETARNSSSTNSAVAAIEFATVREIEVR